MPGWNVTLMTTKISIVKIQWWSFALKSLGKARTQFFPQLLNKYQRRLGSLGWLLFKVKKNKTLNSRPCGKQIPTLSPSNTHGKFADDSEMEHVDSHDLLSPEA